MKLQIQRTFLLVSFILLTIALPQVSYGQSRDFESIQKVWEEQRDRETRKKTSEAIGEALRKSPEERRRSSVAKGRTSKTSGKASRSGEPSQLGQAVDAAGSFVGPMAPVFNAGGSVADKGKRLGTLGKKGAKGLLRGSVKGSKINDVARALKKSANSAGEALEKAGKLGDAFDKAGNLAEAAGSLYEGDAVGVAQTGANASLSGAAASGGAWAGGKAGIAIGTLVGGPPGGLVGGAVGVVAGAITASVAYDEYGKPIVNKAADATSRTMQDLAEKRENRLRRIRADLFRHGLTHIDPSTVSDSDAKKLRESAKQDFARRKTEQEEKKRVEAENKPPAVSPIPAVEPAVKPPAEPPVELPVSPVKPPAEPSVEPPIELPVEPPVPPVEPPVPPVEPPIEPPVEPPVPPVEPPIEPPVKPPVPLVEPPIDSPVEPPVNPPIVLPVPPVRSSSAGTGQRNVRSDSGDDDGRGDYDMSEDSGNTRTRGASVPLSTGRRGGSGGATSSEQNIASIGVAIGPSYGDDPIQRAQRNRRRAAEAVRIAAAANPANNDDDDHVNLEDPIGKIDLDRIPDRRTSSKPPETSTPKPSVVPSETPVNCTSPCHPRPDGKGCHCPDGSDAGDVVSSDSSVGKPAGLGKCEWKVVAGFGRERMTCECEHGRPTTNEACGSYPGTGEPFSPSGASRQTESTTPKKIYGVYLLFESKSAIWVGAESSLKGRATGSFSYGGMCRDAKKCPITYSLIKGPFSSQAAANEAFCAGKGKSWYSLGVTRIKFNGKTYAASGVPLCR